MTTAWWKEERGERIFIDFNQNNRDRTIAGAWSLRARPGAPVSTPMTWAQLAEVNAKLDRAAAGHASATADANQMRSERDVLREKVANTTGQLEALSKQFDGLSRHLSQARKASQPVVRSGSSATNNTKNNKA